MSKRVETIVTTVILVFGLDNLIVDHDYGSAKNRSLNSSALKNKLDYVEISKTDIVKKYPNIQFNIYRGDDIIGKR